ncbi:MAG: N-acetylmuramoyl-L-alanine amidase [Hyphomicrobiales bacterium]|nr:N-acetylmuramoyl-L-alanine amidase [Hyphomicrobiales bacterium]
MPAAGCSDFGTAIPDSPVADRLHPSPNHGPRRGVTRPDAIILHYTGMRDAASALLWLANPLSEVSCHYFVFEDGRVWQMVPESRRAWHAGKSIWAGETDMNSRSIGIEIAHPGHDLTPLPDGGPNPLPPPGPSFPEAQIAAVIRLVADIKARWGIANSRILAHSDIAPGRKIDPGETFPWARLAEAGLGLWSADDGADHGTRQAPAPVFRPGDEGLPIRALQAMFARFGYGIEITGVYDRRTFDVVAAFQRHWRQECVDGVADGETLAMLRALCAAG